jgi:hypothetical protein
MKIDTSYRRSYLSVFADRRKLYGGYPKSLMYKIKILPVSINITKNPLARTDLRYIAPFFSYATNKERKKPFERHKIFRRIFQKFLNFRAKIRKSGLLSQVGNEVVVEFRHQMKY